MIEAIGDGVVICGSGPMEVRHRKSEGIKWCFHCRARHEFEYQVLVPTTEEGWWWGAVPRVVGVSCGTVDGDCFPGCYREWEE